MIIYKKTREHTLFPVFIGFLLTLLCLPNFSLKLQSLSSNTDTFDKISVKTTRESKSLETKHNTEIASYLSLYATPVSLPVTTETSSPCGALTTAPLSDYIGVCGRIIPLDYIGYTAAVSPPAGVAYKLTSFNFLFGHNSYDVFGGLDALLQPGDPIVVTSGGVETVYYFSYYRLNQSQTIIDAEFLPANGSNSLGLMTCAPWVTDGNLDPSRYGFIFTK